MIDGTFATHASASVWKESLGNYRINWKEWGRLAAEAEKKRQEYIAKHGHPPVERVVEDRDVPDDRYWVDQNGTAYVSPLNFARARFDAWMNALGVGP